MPTPGGDQKDTFESVGDDHRCRKQKGNGKLPVKDDTATELEGCLQPPPKQLDAHDTSEVLPAAAATSNSGVAANVGQRYIPAMKIKPRRVD